MNESKQDTSQATSQAPPLKPKYSWGYLEAVEDRLKEVTNAEMRRALLKTRQEIEDYLYSKV